MYVCMYVWQEARSGRREKQVAKEKKKKEDEKSAYACVQQRDVTLAQQVDKYNVSKL